MLLLFLICNLVKAYLDSSLHLFPLFCVLASSVSMHLSGWIVVLYFPLFVSLFVLAHTWSYFLLLLFVLLTYKCVNYWNFLYFFCCCCYWCEDDDCSGVVLVAFTVVNIGCSIYLDCFRFTFTFTQALLFMLFKFYFWHLSFVLSFYFVSILSCYKE